MNWSDQICFSCALQLCQINVNYYYYFKFLVCILLSFLKTNKDKYIVAELIDSMLNGPFWCTFMQYSIAFCRLPEVAGDVISGSTFVKQAVLGNTIWLLRVASLPRFGSKVVTDGILCALITITPSKFGCSQSNRYSTRSLYFVNRLLSPSHQAKTLF